MEPEINYPYYSASVEETMGKVSAREEGLSEEEVKNRQKQFGKNVLPQKNRFNVLLLFVKQFKDFLIFILVIAAGIAWWADQMADVYIILAVILFNAIMGFTQEYKAEKAIASIRDIIRKKATVIRDSQEQEIEVEEVVPGDIILLEEGGMVPADARIFKLKNLRASEASLTGESMPVDKQVEQVEKDLPVGDRNNMVWKGTHIVRGSGKAVVTATGKYTEIGKIATSMSEMKIKDSNFRKKTNHLGKQMAAIAIGTSLVVFVLGYGFRNIAFQEILLVTIATLVSSIPEGLPVVISIVLAIGANRMAKRKAIIREFTATEIMGSVSTILTDKTGTLTQNILVVKHTFTGDGKELEIGGRGYELKGKFSEKGEAVELTDYPVQEKLMLIASFCTNARIHPGVDRSSEEVQDPGEEGEPQVKGEPTEVAMLILGKKAGIRESSRYKDYKVLDDLPFNSEQKFRASLMQTDGEAELFVIGAPERLLELSSRYLGPQGEEPLEADDRKSFRDKMDEWAGEAMRVLALAYKPAQGKQHVTADEVADLILVGLAGIVDPPRQGVKEAIAQCRSAGIRVVMVTGDHKKTAAAIAEEVGILDPEEGQEQGTYPRAVGPQELEKDEEDFKDLVKHVNVFSRVDPNMKLHLVQTLQEQGNLIAMTGDGVNDAPALKRADVGVAMGMRGTDVARNASDIVLQDDNFITIVNAIREGRIVFENVKKTSYFLLTTNFASTAVIILCLAIGYPIPLTAAMILFVNLATDGVMDIALAAEPGHGEVMELAPVKRNANILHWDIIPYLVIMAAFMVLLTLLAFRYYLPQSLATAQTGAFLVVAMTQIFNAYNMRHLKRSVLDIGLLTNHWVNLAFFVSVCLQVLVIKLPFLRELFGFEDLPVFHMLILFFLSSLVLPIGEAFKYLKFKRK